MRWIKGMAVVGAAVLLTAQSWAAAAASVEAPASIKAKKILTFCSDLENPPAEGIADDGVTPKGAAVDMMNDIATSMGVAAKIDNYQFSGLFAALDTGKCDLAVASLGKTPERAQRYELVDYWRFGSGLLVPTGNPKHLTRFEDLSGKRVAVLLGSNNSKALHKISDDLKVSGRPPIDIVELGTNAVAFQDLSLGRVDALVSDTVVMNYYMSRSRGRFSIGGVPVPPKTMSIAIPKGNVDLKNAVQAAIDKMNASGGMTQLIKRWGIENGVVACNSAHPCP
ncbi:amino acid ABC transporter substrate-binding protein (PAAT family) [Trinickia symbiotica]|uniref:ABC transporter substrate-binding protein n=1 Tax=Trinickia symbiotica TaxID=863227 RepID=A0A2N7X6T4_9BURK|nr:ABC transporter substrate-binding protein [Trinickia symbiotica]PMS37185.1 ABC transporter substrate-binding protein [Trinickia symbiotica]PPK42745.1 amino acid ABC transporter substrate-binding protein (PAAT family) [Trinickia symbiotica]